MFKEKIKIKLYFKSGNIIDVTCEKYTIRWNSDTLEYSSYEFDGMEPVVNFVPSRLEAFSVEK